jgi:hypothetical protein
MDGLVIYRGAAYDWDGEGMHTWFMRSYIIVTHIIDKVVYGDSAIIDYSREYRETIYTDHIGMTKFSSKNDPGYKKVLHAIETLLEKLSEGERAPANQSMLNNSFITSLLTALHCKRDIARP